MKTGLSENNKGGQPQVVRHRHVKVQKVLLLMPQLHPQFYQPATKAKARNDLRKQLEAEGFRSIRFDEKQSGRIFVLAWHLNRNPVFSKTKDFEPPE
jgi:hypothetical protein